ncbi:sugar ABC transporter ATP-binding protein, partial [Brucella pituitosa]
RNRSIFVGGGLVFESKSEILNPVHIACSASIFHGYGIPDFGKS